MSTATAESVHWTQPGLATLVEGRDGHGDTCAPIAMLAYRHLAHGVVLSNAVLDDSRRELIAWGLMDTPGEPGMTVSAMATALRDHYSSPPEKVVDYDAALDPEAFHTDLKAAMLTHQAVIMETQNAAALPGNQPGVQRHMILFWGIDSIDGYLCANGDLQAGFGSVSPTIAPVWYTWEQIAPSQPCGYIVLPPAPPPPPPPPPIDPHSYVVREGDTLNGIAADLHLQNAYGDLYKPNQNVLEETARAHGYPSSEEGRWIFPDTVLRY